MSGVYGADRTGVFIDVDGNFTVEESAALDVAPEQGGHGADLFVEFQGRDSNNNFESLTGYTDNSVEQLRSLLEMGFLDVA